MVTVPGGTFTPGVGVNVKFEVSGTSPTTLRFKAWTAGTTEPTEWLLETTDSTSYLQAPGSPGLALQVMSDVANGPVALRVDDVVVAEP